jgi:hypothetical protein
MQVDELLIGSGYGSLLFGDTQMSSVSTLALLTNTITGQTLTILGTTSTAAGLISLQTDSTISLLASDKLINNGRTNTGNIILRATSNITMAAVPSIVGFGPSTGTGTIGIGAEDNIQIATTKNMSLWAGTAPTFIVNYSNAPTVPNLYMASSNSNVGIMTSNPATTLDVAGTGRFQSLSTLNIMAGTMNYSVAFV